MASYPAFPMWKGSRFDPVDDLTVDVAVGGSAKARRFYSGVKHRGVIKHQLSNADAATLEAFYATNAKLPITFTWRGVDYSCLFQGPPKPGDWDGAWCDYEVYLVER